MSVFRVVICLLLAICPVFVSAQNEDFTIRVFGSSDTEAPTTPIMQSVTPITVDQIDLRWSTSTDNFTVFGYVVFRDGVSIATTTLTTYSDSGLSASTTYSYEVVAFDSVPNYSSSSIPVATTTLAIPVVVVPDPVTTSPPLSTIARVVLDSIDVTSDVTAATINIQVRQSARIEVRLGETPSYDKGYFVGSVYRRGHVVPINDLRPNTTYYFEVVGYTPYGIQNVLQQGSFTTLNDAPPPSPVNVTNFTATLDGSAVEASWDLPSTFAPGARVRVVRSHLGFPTGLDDGVVVYEGGGQAMRDASAFVAGDVAYYTAFVLDPNGQVSSGAVALIRQSGQANASDSTGTAENPLPTDSGSLEVPDASSTPYELIPVDPSMPQLTDILISQENVTYSFASTSIPLSSNQLFYVSIPANKIVGKFKTIVATLDDPRGSGKNFSFLLRLNNEETEYTATIAPVQAAGQARLLVDIYDYSAKVVGSYQTQLVFTADRGVSSSTFEVFVWRIQTFAWGILLLTPFITLGGIWFVFRRRHKQDEDNVTSV